MLIRYERETKTCWGKFSENLKGCIKRGMGRQRKISVLEKPTIVNPMSYNACSEWLPRDLRNYFSAQTSRMFSKER